MSNLTKRLNRYDAPSLLALQKAISGESKRRAAATSLISFTEYTYPRYQAGSIHHQIAEPLERVARDEVDRLMLLVPPRHGKSELASRRFPAWYLGRHPDKQYLCLGQLRARRGFWARCSQPHEQQRVSRDLRDK